jgi:hypothetical protein
MTTFVLGAGASRHAGYPLACELGDGLLEWLCHDKMPTPDYRMNIERVHDLYEGLGDIEAILTDLEGATPSSRAAVCSPVERALLRRSFATCIPEFFYDLSAPNASPLYARFAREKVKRNDTVITFNYDIACERELRAAGLWEVGDGYGFSLNLTGLPPSHVNVLKLHGSVNWLSILFGGLRNACQWGVPAGLGERPVIYGSRNFVSLGYPPGPRDANYSSTSAPGAEPALIMGLYKRFYSTTSFGCEHAGFWESLWCQAAESLKVSDDVVIIGYSLPAADADARQILLHATNREAHVIVCCGDHSKAICKEFNKAGFENVDISGEGFFEDYFL